MRGTKAKKIRKAMPPIEPGYKTLGNGQVVSRKRIEYQRAKKAN